MGVYVYAVHPDPITVVMDGRERTAYAIRYAYKPLNSWCVSQNDRTNARWHRAAVGAVLKRWREEMPGRRPMLVFFPKNQVHREGRFADGTPFIKLETIPETPEGGEIRTWTGAKWCYDEPQFPGKRLGVLRRDGERWVIAEKPANEEVL